MSGKHAAKHKAKGKAQVSKGLLKKAARKATDDPALEGEGQVGQEKGNLKQTGEKVKEPAGKN